MLRMNSILATAIFAWFFALRLGGTVAYSASLQPRHCAPTSSILSSAMPSITITQTQTFDPYLPASEELLQMKSVFGRVFRRGRNKRVQTLDKEDAKVTKKQKEPEELWKVLFHNSEYTPDSVARILTKVFPITRMTAFDICVRARSAGTVVVVITNKKQAEKYCGALLRRGLMANIEPHSNSDD